MQLRGTMKLHRHDRAALFGIISLLVCLVAVADSPGTVEVGRFSAEAEGTSVPVGWKPWRFKKIERLTDYTTVKEEGSVVVRANADNSASGLIRDVKIDPAEYPFLHWRWKVSNTYVRGDVRSKDGDDYPARIYLAFDYDPQRLGLLDRAKYGAVKLLYGQAPPLRVINYIWESKAPKDTITSSAYTDWVKMIVVESGPSLANRWIAEQRNVVEDFRRAFGEDPGMITGVAIMTDADNTGEAATAWYGDIVFRKQ